METTDSKLISPGLAPLRINVLCDDNEEENYEPSPLISLDDIRNKPSNLELEKPDFKLLGASRGVQSASLKVEVSTANDTPFISSTSGSDFKNDLRAKLGPSLGDDLPDEESSPLFDTPQNEKEDSPRQTDKGLKIRNLGLPMLATGFKRPVSSKPAPTNTDLTLSLGTAKLGVPTTMAVSNSISSLIRGKNTTSQGSSRLKMIS